MRVLFVLPYPLGTVPGQRYRIEQWLPLLRAAGIDATVQVVLRPHEQLALYGAAGLARKAGIVGRTVARSVRLLRDARPFDVVWVHRTISLGGPALVERGLASLGPPIVYEFDDAIWLTQTMESNKRWSFLKFSGKTAAICRLARSVVVGNDFLAGFARRHNAQVHVVPSTVDLSAYSVREHAQGLGPTVVGWSGSPTTTEHLALVTDALRDASAQHPIEVRLVGGDFDFPGVPVVRRPWTAATEVDNFRSFDIGLMPLLDNDWSRGKCAMKGLLYMAAGVPVVASPVGMNSQLIQDGVNGLLARTEDEWREKILLLARDVDLRRRLGAAGRAAVERWYSPEVQVPRVVEILREACGRAHSA